MVFVAGCIAYCSDPDSTQTQFEQLTVTYQTMPSSMQQALQETRLLAVIYLASTIQRQFVNRLRKPPCKLTLNNAITVWLFILPKL